MPVKKVTVKKARKKPFSSLSLNLQKKSIVKDAIAQIHAGKLIVKTGDYFNIEQYGSSSNDLQTLLQAEGTVCEVCAKGALFASCVIKTNAVKITDPLGSEPFEKKKLSKWFSTKELDMIEATFERGSCADENGILSTTGYDEDGEELDDPVYTKLYADCINYRDSITDPVGEPDNWDEDEDGVWNQNQQEEKAVLLAILENILKNGVFDPTK